MVVFSLLYFLYQFSWTLRNVARVLVSFGRFAGFLGQVVGNCEFLKLLIDTFFKLSAFGQSVDFLS